MSQPRTKRRKFNDSSTNEMNRNINIIPPIKMEPFDDEVIIKMEPPGSNNEHEERVSLPGAQSENGPNKASLVDDEEMGLISELEFIKSEIDVDESMLKEFRAEILRESKQHEMLSQPVVSMNRVDDDDDQSLKLRGKRDKAPKGGTEGNFMRRKKEIIVCRFCDFKTTTRNRSYFLKDHMRTHTGETPFKCAYCVQTFRLAHTLHYHVKHLHPTKPIFRCELCRLIIYDEETFHAHEYKCVKIRSFECHLCKITYARVQKHKIREHMRRAHTGDQVHPCQHCAERFVTKARLANHLQRVHPNTMSLICSVCNQRFDKEEKLFFHERNCKTRRRFQCHLCGYTYLKMTMSCLKMHMRKHTGDKPFKCCYCSKTFPRDEALRQHLQRSHYTLQCRRCHRRCLDAKALETHEMYCRRRRYECYMCSFTRFGISFSKFRRHMLIKHTGESGIKCLCVVCPKRFASKNVFGAHITHHHPDLLKLICLICNQSFKTTADRKLHQDNCTKKRYECFLCRQSLANLKKLRIHMVHAHTGEKKYRCEQCARSFQIEVNLKIHMKSHTINKADLPKCSYCNKRFIDIKYKKKHEFQCKKRYECYLCKKSFKNFTELHGKHFRSHLGERPYQCMHCGKTIASIRCYKMHVIGYHLAAYRFKCNECNGNITKRKDFRLHQHRCMKPIRQSANIYYFTCSLCLSPLKRLPELKDHVIFNKCKNHPNEKIIQITSDKWSGSAQISKLKKDN